MAVMNWLHDARDDLWFGCRRLSRDLDATTAVVLVLACGIGLSVAMFAVADTVLRRPLPVLDQARVVVLWAEAGGSMRTLPLSPQHFERYRNEARTLQEVAGTLSIDSWAQPVRDGGETFRVNVSPVTGNFFVVLGSKAILGRTFAPDDDHPGAAPVAVLSYSLWRGQFAGNPTGPRAPLGAPQLTCGHGRWRCTTRVGVPGWHGNLGPLRDRLRWGSDAARSPVVPGDCSRGRGGTSCLVYA